MAYISLVGTNSSTPTKRLMDGKARRAGSLILEELLEALADLGYKTSAYSSFS
jgi:hypothetical protein